MKTLYTLILAYAFTVPAIGADLTYEQASAQIPPIAEGKGRIFLLRGKFQASLVRPDILLNGKMIGTSTSGDFFLVDKLPGDYEMRVSTEVTNTLKLSLKAGETKYVMFNMVPGFFVARVEPTLIDEPKAKHELSFGLTWKTYTPINDPTETLVGVPVTAGESVSSPQLPSTVVAVPVASSSPLAVRIPVVVVATPASAPTQSTMSETSPKSQGSIASRLGNLKKLYEEGLITEEEYAVKRKEILGTL